MRANTKKNLVVSLIAVAIIALGVNGYAYKSMGSQKGGKGCGGCESYQKDGGCGKGKMNENLTSEQREQIEAERTAFIEATAVERQNLNDKKMALWNEIAKEEPDVKKAGALQEEISELRASLDKKMLNHIISVRKINPDAGKRYLMQGGGYHGKGQRMGYKSGDCPYKE